MVSAGLGGVVSTGLDESRSRTRIDGNLEEARGMIEPG